MAYINQKQYYTNNSVNPTDSNWGSYQFVSLTDIVTNFLLMYQGNHEMINNVNRFKVLFHATAKHEFRDTATTKIKFQDFSY